MYNPETVAKLQHAVRAGNYKMFKQFSDLATDEDKRFCTIRGLLKFRQGRSIPLDEVEPASAVVTRFKTGAMSLGSISREAHENLAIAMNRLGGRSNTGEGGEDPVRYKPLPNGEPGPNLYCAVIVKRVDEKTRSKTSINDLLRD